MLKDTEISAVSTNPPDATYFGTILSDTALMALRNLVYRSQEWRNNRGYYMDVYAAMVAARTAALAGGATGEQKAVAQVLAAVVLKLRRTPGIRVEDEGSQEAKSFYSSPDNWEELALDVLGILYLPAGGGATGSGSFIVATRDVVSDFLCHRPNNDELFLTCNGLEVRTF